MEASNQACKYFGPCGGCTFQAMPYEKQLESKANQVKTLIDSVYYLFEGKKGSPAEWGYRNKMEFSFGDELKDGPLP